MKNIKLTLVLLLFTQLIFSQKTYKITEGELQFIHPDEGVYIKKENTLYQLKLEDISDYEEFSKGFKYELSNTTFEEIEKLKKDASTVFSTNIIKYDFKNLDKKKFITKIDDDDNYQLNKYNKDFFSIGILEDSLSKPKNEYLFHYCILDFGKGKKIIYHSEGFIIPTKDKVKFLFEDYSLNEAFKKFESTKFTNLTALEIHTKAYDIGLNQEFYKIDTLQNNKLYIKDLYNQKVINKSFDSIVFDYYFIIGFKNKKINIYNYTFQKLNLKKVKTFSFDRFYPTLQVIENNKLRSINLVGTDFKYSDLSFQMSFSHFFPNNTIRLNITKENETFYLVTDDITSIVQNYALYENKYKIINSNEYESVEFLDEFPSFTISSEMGNYSVKYPILMYTKLKNGKYNLNTIEYLITENPNLEIENYNNTLPKNLNSISKISQDIYLIEKNNLFTFYPLIKEIKYKSLGKFQGNFARFELPNGKKGWLSSDGKEYLDD